MELKAVVSPYGNNTIVAKYKDFGGYWLATVFERRNGELEIEFKRYNDKDYTELGSVEYYSGMVGTRNSQKQFFEKLFRAYREAKEKNLFEKTELQVDVEGLANEIFRAIEVLGLKKEIKHERAFNLSRTTYKKYVIQTRNADIIKAIRRYYVKIREFNNDYRIKFRTGEKTELAEIVNYISNGVKRKLEVKLTKNYGIYEFSIEYTTNRVDEQETNGVA